MRPSGDAPTVSGRRRTTTTRLRICPACGSDAVISMVVHERDDSGVRVDVHCGECATWRTEALSGARARIALARVRRIHRRQRRDIETDLRVVLAYDAGYRPAVQSRATDR